MKQQLVAFDAGHLQERGTDVALYDYAHFNETLLGNRSLVLAPINSDLSCLEKFRRRFSVSLYRDRRQLEGMLAPVDLYYRIDHGHRPARAHPRPPHGRTGIHCVFKADQPHGDVYAAVSSWVAKQHGDADMPVVPHMVHLPAENGDLRAELGIPASATVLGRHGGPDTFDIRFVHQVLPAILDRRQDLYLLLMNTRRFAEHPRIIHLPRTADMLRKTRFINSCDGMLHARGEGETFGLSVGEFSIRNKPVLTWMGSPDRHHIEVLGEKGFYYRSAEDLAQLLWSFRPMAGDFDAFTERFAPEPVMAAFSQVFLVRPRPLPSAPEPKGRFSRPQDSLEVQGTA
ncbi:MAG: hypothetical protein ACYTG5_17175 [Planctomycetota bacterium]|jgi:hypothetical protein